MGATKYPQGLQDGNEAMLVKVMEEINCKVEEAWQIYEDSLGDSWKYGIYEGLLEALFTLEKLGVKNVLNVNTEKYSKAIKERMGSLIKDA